LVASINLKFHSFSKISIAIFGAFSLIGFSLQEDAISKTKVLFNTKAEAKAAAKELGCKGAHRMGAKWMPCSMHNNYKEKKPNFE
tara:strand:- start:541 stop:795 length:255 start_codon:yes stop_codon:yes gene_type:complete